ncbi:e3 ubiquitin-protein ligase [Gigaspora margarita]|uniref:E3 ubiquitin-protein ligase n=1 Tax=Gigaspora margarita TaxID=4874 RepID=A0A8H3XEL8_GIGMA|nr:e3 ubiquitin-protein ligase [Gigaspora margarita]
MKRSVNPNRNISSIILPPRITLTAKNLPPRITSTPKLGDHTVEPNIGLVSTAKNIIGGTLSRFIGKDDDEYKECIQVTFHVHLPQHIERFGEPVVVGSCKELGNWRMVRILLTQPNKREFPTYWRSQPIEIQPSKDEIKYKYGVFDRSSGRVEFEGEGERHNRTLDTKTNDQYDIWKNNNRFRIFNLNEFAFIRCIYDAVNDENLKDKVMQFQLLLTNHRTHTLNFMTLDFITQRYQKKEKRLFLSVLLGYYIIDKGSPAFIFQLPKQFRSELLLEAFEHVQQDTFTSDIKPIIAPVVAALVRHNAMVMISFEWLRIFRVAQFVDPAYTFVDEFIGAHYDKKYISRLLKEWPEIVKPHLDRIDESTYIKIAKWLISCCSNMETVNIMSQYNIEDTLLRSNNEICVDYVVNALMPAVHEDYIKTLKKLI